MWTQFAADAAFCSFSATGTTGWLPAVQGCPG